MIKLEATEKEINALVILIDLAVKSMGIRGAGDAINWIVKIEAAVNEAKALDKAV